MRNDGSDYFLQNYFCFVDHLSLSTKLDKIGLYDYAKDGRKQLFTRCITLFNQIPRQSLRIHNWNAMHLGEKLLITICSIIAHFSEKKSS